MIIRPLGNYKELLRKLPFGSRISAVVTRMSESLSLLQELDFEISKDPEKNIQEYVLAYDSKAIVLKTIVTRNELFVMLYDR